MYILIMSWEDGSGRNGGKGARAADSRGDWTRAAKAPATADSCRGGGGGLVEEMPRNAVKSQEPVWGSRALSGAPCQIWASGRVGGCENGGRGEVSLGVRSRR